MIDRIRVCTVEYVEIDQPQPASTRPFEGRREHEPPPLVHRPDTFSPEVEDFRPGDPDGFTQRPDTVRKLKDGTAVGLP